MTKGGREFTRFVSVLVCFTAFLWMTSACAGDTGSIGNKDSVTAGYAGRDESCDWEMFTDDLEVSYTARSGYPKYHFGRVWDRYRSLFWRQPNVVGVLDGYVTDENGEWTDTWGIIIRVSEKVDQDTLPPEDRIPQCLRGVPIQIREWEDPVGMGPLGEDNPCGVDTLPLARELFPFYKEKDFIYGYDDLERIVGGYIGRVYAKYGDLIENQPTWHRIGPSYFIGPDGDYLESPGIVVEVLKKFDQDTLPPEERLPECLDGIPVQIVVGSPAVPLPYPPPEYEARYEAKYGEEDMGSE